MNHFNSTNIYKSPDFEIFNSIYMPSANPIKRQDMLPVHQSPLVEETVPAAPEIPFNVP